MLAVGAGDNVVRLLPPLIISEQEIAEGVARLDRACARLSRSLKQPADAGRRKEEAAG
jgi:acetylornithine/N-succinyldiaminopimelate aminotransferase